MSTRMERLSMPLARDAIRQLTEAAGGCTRPVQLRRTDNTTGKTDQLLVPCGSTREDQCPACAKRAASLRAQQCREGWHLDRDPEPPAPVPDGEQEAWLLLRAEAQVRRDHALAANTDTSGCWTSSSASSTTTSRPPAYAAPSPSHPITTTSRGPGGHAPPAAARTPPSCPRGRL